MKINWFSPVPPAATDIAHYTTRVLPALASLADITLWTTKAKWPASLERHAEVRRYGLDRIPWLELNRADATFYNIGNNPGFHRAIWHLSRVHPGVIILHDFRLHHFFDGIYRLQWQDINLYLNMMERYYGKTSLPDAEECFKSHAANIEYMAQRYPLTELALENSFGVIVHTTEAFDHLRRLEKWPVAFASLPFAARTEARTDWNSLPYRLIVFGYLGRNRRLISLLRALAGLDERDSFHLDIFGVVLDDEHLIRSEIKKLKLTRLVTLQGFVPEPQLDGALSTAHLAVNLRHPTMGEASGSQLRIWSHALPSLVSQVGWYAALPDDSVAMVRPDGNEVSDIQKHLNAFLKDPEKFAAMGRRGFEHLETDHSPDAYAATLIEMAAQARQFRLRVAAEQLAMRAAMPISDWLAPVESDEALRRIVGQALSFAKK